MKTILTIALLASAITSANAAGLPAWMTKEAAPSSTADLLKSMDEQADKRRADRAAIIRSCQSIGASDPVPDYTVQADCIERQLVGYARLLSLLSAKDN